MTDKELAHLFSDLKKNENEEKIDLKKFIYQCLRYWYWFVIGLAVMGGLAFVYLQIATPQYEITSKLLVKDQKRGQGLSDTDLINDLGIVNQTKNVLNEIEVLKSESLMQRVFSELSLNAAYYTEGTFKDKQLYGDQVPIKVVIHKLDTSAYDMDLAVYLTDNNSFDLEETDEDGNVSVDQFKFGEEISKAYAIFTITPTQDISALGDKRKKILLRFRNVAGIARDATDQLEVESVNEDASVLALSMKNPIPQLGKDIMNTLIEDYKKEDIEDKNIIASNTLAFLDERLEYLATDLSGVEKNVEEFKQKNELTDVSSEATMYLEEASDYNKQLAEVEIQLDVLNSIENYLEDQENKYALIPNSLSTSTTNQPLFNPISKFNEIQLERQRLLRTLNPGNPLLTNMDEQLQDLRINIIQNLKNEKESLNIKRRNLIASSKKYTSHIEKVPTIERKLLEINRQQGVKEKLYLYLLQKREESSLALAATVANSRVIDPAMSSDDPVSPRKTLIWFLALMAGLGLPMAAIFFMNITNDKVQEREDVEKMTSTPILGELPHDRSHEYLLVKKGKRLPIAEMFRLIRTNLQFASVDKSQVFLVTSGRNGEGKTFFSINFAASLSLTGKKVVIAGFDLRKPKLTDYLKVPKGKGITDYLVSPDIRIDDVIKPVNTSPNIFVIGAGSITPDPAELMMSEKVDKLIAELRARFDYIILDTAPIGMLADAFALAPYIDSSIFLVRYRYTEKAQLEVIDDIFRHKKLKRPLIVINDAKRENNIGRGYGSYGVYGSKS